MEDIEDVIRVPATINLGRDYVIVRKRLKGDGEIFYGDSFVPGTQKIYIRTWGCTHNTSDSEQMAGLLSAAGHQLTNKKVCLCVYHKQDASLWILNSCTVKTPSETQLENTVKEARKLNKFIIVAGCVSQAEPNLRFLDGISIVGVKQIECVTQAVEETLKGNCVRFLSRRKPNSNLLLPKIRKNKFIEILAISTGCLNHCTYCKTKSARGNLVSYPLDSLLERARNAFADGCKELWLTSEDLGAWGRDIDMVLPDLLNALVEIIPEGCMLRLGMTNPPYILDFLEEISEILNHPRVYSFLHIPVQSASDAVLSDMKREYTCIDFCRVVDYMIQNVPNIYIATDFICAYPTETESDFEESMALVRKYRFPSLFINQFYPRIGTPAANLKKIDTIEARRRTAEMSSLFRSYSRYNKERIGEKHRVLVCELATDQQHYVGHNKYYEHFLIPSKKCLLGKWVQVRITDVSKFYMKAVLIGGDINAWLSNGPMAGISVLAYSYRITAFSMIMSILIFWLLLL
uniref:tRNA-t(6)A37 methylthiotransferase n=1 Tax=Wuchereria bancrofti TaxID=6293 RepID=A0A1I8EWV1_WUCBA